MPAPRRRECAARVVEYLRGHGYDVVWIAEANAGVDDPTVLARCRADARQTFSFDLDLAERIVRGTDTAADVL